MKTVLSACAAVAALSTAAFVTAEPSVVYNDATGDVASGIYNPSGILDLASMEVSNDATDIYFKLTINGAGFSPDWGKYMIGIATGNGNGTSSGNGWNRPISMNAYGGMTHWVGSWVDSGGGAQLWTHNNGWSETAATYSSGFGGFTISGNSITYKLSMGSLGLGYGSVFAFDAYSSGGGNSDAAIDALANNNPSTAPGDWSTPYVSTNSGVFLYTVQLVPAPGAVALVGMAGLIARRRKA